MNVTVTDVMTGAILHNVRTRTPKQANMVAYQYLTMYGDSVTIKLTEWRF